MGYREPLHFRRDPQLDPDSDPWYNPHLTLRLPDNSLDPIPDSISRAARTLGPRISLPNHLRDYLHSLYLELDLD